MPRILNKNPNASSLLNGIMFAALGEYMASVEPVEGEAAELLLSIPGFEALDEGLVAASAPDVLLQGENVPPLAITGVMSHDGPYNINVPMPDGSTLNIQGEHPSDPNPVLQGDGGAAAQAASEHAGAAPVTTEPPAGDSAGAGEQKDPPAAPAADAKADEAPAAGAKKPAARKGAAKQ